MKTSELTGAALDWAVAKCNQDWTDEDCWYNTIGYVDSGDPDDEPYDPSTNWALGGPIIEREHIQLGGGAQPNDDAHWFALKVKDDKSGCYKGHGPTPLIAAMRCFVASRLGDDVEIPEELL